MLQKTPININFSKGMNTNVDSKQLPIGEFESLVNSTFDKEGRLTKRTGYPLLTTLPNNIQTTITTLNDNLIATGSRLYAYSAPTDEWLNQGSVEPVQVSVQSTVRASTSQVSTDLAVAENGLACLVYVDNSSGGSFYQISDTGTGQQIVARTALPSTALHPRVFVLGSNFVITFKQTVAATPTLLLLAIPVNAPSNPGTPVTISSSLGSVADSGYDGVVANDTLYMAWEGASSNNVRLAYVSQTLVISTPVVLTTQASDLMSVTADNSGSTPVIWATWWDSSSTNAVTVAYDHILNQILAPTQSLTGVVINEITSSVSSGLLSIFYQTTNTYSFSPNNRSDYVSRNTVTIAGVVGSPIVILRSVGLASKAFVHTNGSPYMLVGYQGINEPTYFLINSNGNVYARIAPGNGNGYRTTQVLPNVSSLGTTYMVPYGIKSTLVTVNKQVDTSLPTNAIFTQVGVNIGMFQINTANQFSSEIAGSLHLTGGQLWQYDGVRPVEHGFHLYPEDVAGSTNTAGGSITAQDYFYSFTYEWTDNQGNLHRSAPSIPIKITTTGATSTNTINVPTLRLTRKISPNPVRIIGYRWSTAQPVFYQFTSFSSPTLNSTTADSVTFTDTSADSSILGNTVLYTTGGVLENIAAPANVHSALYKNRLFVISAEDPNTLWFSKEILPGVPVEMSDLLTYYVAPTTGSQGSTGPSRCLASMDDKLIIFKDSAAYYITGSGPTITGSGNDFSEPVFIAGSVGCNNPNSIALIPDGLVFQSDKGIWLLGRDLSTKYIGSPVSDFNDRTVLSAEVIPGTNQVRFIIDNGVTLMYDYHEGQWGTFNNIRAISATLYQGKHTYLNTFGQVYQQDNNTYSDGSIPVLLKLKTGWINLAGLQGLERFYFMYLIGSYKSPFKLNVEIAYDYNPSPQHNIIVSPDNFDGPYGSQSVWGSPGGWGGTGDVFEARIFPKVQKCSSFQLTITELYDPSLGSYPGEGLNLSGMNLVVGVKKGYRTQKSGRSFG